jgi:hypothetical protein
MDEPIIVDAELINNTILKLKDPLRATEAVADIKKIVDIKQTLLWRADAGTCCGSLSNISASLTCDIALMEKALKALEKNDTAEAILVLEEYKNLLGTR